MEARPEKGHSLRALGLIAVIVTLGVVGCGNDGADNAGSPTNSVAGASERSGPGSTGAEGDKANSGSASSASGDAAGGVSGNDSSDTSSSSKYVEEPSPIQLFTDSTSDVRVTKPTVRLATGQRQLDALIKSQASSKADRPTIPVNFSEKRQVIAVFMPKSRQGSQVTVVSVSNNGTQTKVKALMLVPPKDCKAKGSSNTRPTAWVETRRLPGRRVVLVIDRQPQSGC